MSGYLDFLPAIFQDDPFLGRFLLAFERILTGRMGSPAGLEGIEPGIEELLDRIHRFFDPGASSDGTASQGQTGAPEEFLPWLAGWVGVSLRDDWSADKRRSFIQQATTLYKMRGTPSGLAQMVSLYTDCPVQIFEPDEAQGGAPHYFRVVVSLMGQDRSIEWVEDSARFIIEQEKPAHTWYGLTVETPDFVFQIIDNVDASTEGLVAGHTTVLGVAPLNVSIGTDESDGSSSVVGMRIKNRTDSFNPGLRIGRTTLVQAKE